MSLSYRNKPSETKTIVSIGRRLWSCGLCLTWPKVRMNYFLMCVYRICIFISRIKFKVVKNNSKTHLFVWYQSTHLSLLYRMLSDWWERKRESFGSPVYLLLPRPEMVFTASTDPLWHWIDERYETHYSWLHLSTSSLDLLRTGHSADGCKHNRGQTLRN